MCRIVKTLLVMSCLLTAATSQVQSKPLSNDDVMQMVSLGLGDDVIIEKIRSAPTTDFDTGINGLKALKAAKVSDAVLKAMIHPLGSSTVAVSSQPTAAIDTTAGKLTCNLFPDKAPIGVANFIGLSDGTKDWVSPITHQKNHGISLYDGTIFHRVIPNFMIQGGDPMGTGTGTPGYVFKNETSPDLKFDRPGRLAYANAGPGTNGSQFFITETAYPSLNGGYTIFGQCDDVSVELVKQIARMARDSNDRPYQPVRINHITVSGDNPGEGVAVAQDAATRQRYVREEAGKKMAGNLPPGYNISADGPKSTIYVLHQHGVTFPLCNNTVSTQGFVANLEKRGFTYFVCTDDGSTKFTFDLAKQAFVGSQSAGFVPVTPPVQGVSVQEDFPLRFTIIEGHVTSTPKCWMTIRNEGDGVTYVVEQVTLFGCVLFDPGQTDVKGKRDKRWFDLVGTDKKGKVKVTRWEIKQQAM